jgi:hypothetical protein
VPNTRTLVIAGVVGFIALAAAITMNTMNSRGAFVEYRQRTLQGPEAPWNRAVLDVPGCVDATIEWTLNCEGLQSWCAATVPVVMQTCLDSQPRDAYCKAAGERVRTTRFGYGECEARWSAVTEKYERRATKKHCAASYRAIAEHCVRNSE